MLILRRKSIVHVSADQLVGRVRPLWNHGQFPHSLHRVYVILYRWGHALYIYGNFDVLATWEEFKLIMVNLDPANTFQMPPKSLKVIFHHKTVFCVSVTPPYVLNWRTYFFPSSVIPQQTRTASYQENLRYAIMSSIALTIRLVIFKQICKFTVFLSFKFLLVFNI